MLLVAVALDPEKVNEPSDVTRFDLWILARSVLAFWNLVLDATVELDVPTVGLFDAFVASEAIVQHPPDVV